MATNAPIAIDLRHVVKTYGSGPLAVKAVDDVSLHVVEGEVVAIMGPSGSGKTTLLQVIGCLLTPASGAITVEGEDITVLPQASLAGVRLRTFGFVFQTPNLLSALSAVKNVEVVLNLAGTRGKEAKRIARGLLVRLGLGNRLHHKPSQLSGGEQQRVAIARALANDPPILLADEPTANLDSRSGQTVMEILRGIAKEQGKTVVVVSHDLRIRHVVDRVLWLEDGRLRVRWSDGATVDPVCLMVLEKGETGWVAEYGGRKEYFCSAECQRRFESEPDRYRGKGAIRAEDSEASAG